MISEDAQSEILRLQSLHPDKQIVLVAEKGTVGSSRMSGVNNVALWTGANSPYVPFVNVAPIVAVLMGYRLFFLPQLM